MSDLSVSERVELQEDTQPLEALSTTGSCRAVMQRTADRWAASGAGVRKCTEDKLLVCILRAVAKRMDSSGELFHKLCTALQVDANSIPFSEHQDLLTGDLATRSTGIAEESAGSQQTDSVHSEQLGATAAVVIRQEKRDDDFLGGPLDQMLPKWLAHIDAATCSEFISGLCNRVVDVVPALSQRSHPHPTHWKLGRVLGKGAFGECRIAIDQDSGRLFALKTVPVSGSRTEVAELLHCLRQEVRVLTGVRHPNVVQCYGVSLDYGSAERERVNISMEYVEGGSLASLINEFGPLPTKVGAAYARQMVLGLQYLHTRGVAHGDIKPGNVLIDKNGIVKLSDFGSSRLMGAQEVPSEGAACEKFEPLDASAGGGAGFEEMMQQSPKLEVRLREGSEARGRGPRGTPSYMAPEIVRGARSSARSDVWSLGITVLEMLTGSCGYHLSTPLATMYTIGRGTPPKMPADLDSGARSMICLCTIVDPLERPHAGDLLPTPFIEAGRREEAAGAEAETLAVLLNLVALLSKLQIREAAEPRRRRAKGLLSCGGAASSAQLEELPTPTASVESPSSAPSPSPQWAPEAAAGASRRQLSFPRPESDAEVLGELALGAGPRKEDETADPGDPGITNISEVESAQGGS